MQRFILKIFTLVYPKNSIFLIIWKQKSVDLNPLFGYFAEKFELYLGQKLVKMIVFKVLENLLKLTYFDVNGLFAH